MVPRHGNPTQILAKMDMLKFAAKVILVIAVARVIENAVLPANSTLKQYLP